ncbi:hypothetical protein GCM10010987_32750 [Bradyrhizobium guangdongense]|uniref:Uncharacterized protein n=1 Tax=Bradyrhizobium guangdongense TaxID=1325090 RepID=A0AA87W4A0_9BRAD|nr:hypothetical protein GCM10010987_32750 [Bradyrhizobium guangdongense]
MKGWNRKVRITKAIRRAWITTRTVSPTPLSVFVPEVTLIALSIPAGDHRTPPSRVQPTRSRPKEIVLILIVGPIPA